MQLHDIFPVIDTTWYLVKLGSIALLITVGVLFFLWRWSKRKKKKTRPYYLNILSNCDFNDSKRTANQISYYGKYVARTPQDKKRLHNLITTLTPYKYNKETSPLPLEIQKEIETFLAQLGAKDV